MPEYIPLYLRPPNSPDLNTIDNQIQATMHELDYNIDIHSVDQLKQLLIHF